MVIRRRVCGVRPGLAGFTIIETVTALLLIGLVAAFAIPRALHRSPMQEVEGAARQLARDLELARSRALSAKRATRVVFDAGADFYTVYTDTSETRSGTIAMTAAEVHQSQLVVRGSHAGIPGVELPAGVVFGAGIAGSGPLGEATSDPVLLSGDRLDFDSYGMIMPIGTNGVIYLTHEDDAGAVAAVTVSGAGAFEPWRYRNGTWQR
jgi:type II secretory pathway pseudopilin PulG